MKRALITAALAVVGFATTSALADTLVNIDLSGATVGATIPTAPFGATPITAFTGIGGYTSDPLTPTYGWSYPHAGLGTAVVSNVAGIGKAATLTSDTTNAEVGALTLDTSLGVSAQQLVLSFDINVLSQAASGYGQLVGGAPVLFGVRLYSPTTFNWVTSFTVSPTSSTTGILGFRNVDNTVLQTIGTYDVGSADHIEIDVNYATGTANAYVNNVLAYSGYPLRGGIAPAATTSEMFMYLNGSSGSANEVAVGNVTLQSGFSPFDQGAVPLPAAAWGGMVLLGGLVVANGVKRFRRQEA